MGCCYSRVEREEIVSRCRARKRYTKDLVEARRFFSTAHTLYIRSLRNTGSALLHFANAESDLHQSPQLHPQPPRPPPAAPGSPTTDTWSSATTSPSPPPPPPPSSTWDFWDPFFPAVAQWDAKTAAIAEPNRNAAAAVSPISKTPSSEERAVVISRNSKSLREVAAELDVYFLKAADAGRQVSFLLEVPSGSFSTPPVIWAWKLSNSSGMSDNLPGHSSGHSSTIQKLCSWEKKLYLEVKNAELMKADHENKVSHLRNMEVRRADHVKIHRSSSEIENLESRMMVASQAIETTSDEILKLRESELYPQIADLIKGLMCMWRSMNACHQVQGHIVHQLKYLNPIPSTQTSSEIHRQSLLQLELEVHQWQTSFSNLLKAQRLYIQSLTGWLRLSLFQLKLNPVPQTTQESTFYSLCEEWHLVVDRLPDQAASEGINSLSTAIHAIVIQQADEHRQKKRLDSVFKELEKRAIELKSLEMKYGPYFAADVPNGKNPVEEKRLKVEALKAKAEEEKKKHENSITLTRTMTLANLLIALPHTFQAMSRFSSAYMQMFESAYSKAKGSDHLEQESKSSTM